MEERKINRVKTQPSVDLNYGSVSGQSLRFVNSGEIPDAVLEVLARCTAFYLDHHLNIIRLSDESQYLQTIIDDSKEGIDVVFPCLQHLSIHYFWCLTCIWEDVLPEESFAALRTVFACMPQVDICLLNAAVRS
ncbi:disease resistance protein [Gossypium australe]|uniref:Disease resistance protein n=1 Tax=Gossypium australe TaxID=47621 RepID=A0A5B6WFD1_9ROSI|nr:disease resistance protein [Gossypium australe]